MTLTGKLFDGPIDIVGDVHGEIEALERLLVKLGYDRSGEHPEGRRLVFLGDLTDRGPDSPAVLERVAKLVADGRAQCLLGNHELNLLRGELKHGNDWWVKPESVDDDKVTPIGRDAESARQTRERLTQTFLRKLPVALERDDLRVVHACWHPESLAVLAGRAGEGGAVEDLYREYQDQIEAKWAAGEARERLEAERQALPCDLKDRSVQPPFLPVLAEKQAEEQMGNPVSVVTSGVEQPTSEPFWAGGKWRMLNREKWWDDYDDPVPVIVGHYWRRYLQTPGVIADKYGPDLFAGIEPRHWMGRRNNVYCVDFSVGGRAGQRAAGEPEAVCQLAALRVPEWEVVHDDGGTWVIGEPDAFSRK